MATEMSFRDLFNHLEKYIQDPEQRWKQVMRVKRGLADCNSIGGYGNDQVYFEGAVEIIRNLEQIDFNLLYSGKVCVDELPRIRRLARCDCIKLPKFMKDLEKYKRSLRQIGYTNGLIARPERKGPLKCFKPNKLKSIPPEVSSKTSATSLKKPCSCFSRCAGKRTTPSPPLPKAPMLTRSTNNLHTESSLSRCFRCHSFSDDEDMDAKSVDAIHSGPGEGRLLSRPKQTNKLNGQIPRQKAVLCHADSSSGTGDFFGLLDRAPLL